jgi:hypothetical protein
MTFQPTDKMTPVVEALIQKYSLPLDDLQDIMTTMLEAMTAQLCQTSRATDKEKEKEKERKVRDKLICNSIEKDGTRCTGKRLSHSTKCLYHKHCK